MEELEALSVLRYVVLEGMDQFYQVLYAVYVLKTTTLLVEMDVESGRWLPVQAMTVNSDDGLVQAQLALAMLLGCHISYR